MILLYKCTKWRKGQGYYNSSAWVYSGSATTTDAIPKIPRLPMFPDMGIERTWIEYFRVMHRLLEDHLEDYQMHKRK